MDHIIALSPRCPRGACHSDVDDDLFGDVEKRQELFESPEGLWNERE